MNPMKTLSVFCLMSTAVYPQEFWQGTKYGMGKPELRKLFGAKLTAGEEPATGHGIYIAYGTQRPFCGCTFRIDFIFLKAKPADTLFAVALQTPPGESRRSVPECVIRQYIASYGRPVQVGRDGLVHDEYVFSRGETIVEISAGKESGFVTIKYTAKVKGL